MFTILFFTGWMALHTRSAFIWREQPPLTLTEAQKKHLKNIQAPIKITAFVDGNPRLVRGIYEIIAPVKTLLPQLTFTVINPDTHPIAVKEYDITRAGQLYIAIGENGQRLDIVSPESIIRTILQLSGNSRQQILHLQGDGERAAFADVGGSWRALYKAIASPQLDIVSINLKHQINLPENVALTIIADPDNRNIAHLDAAIATYLNHGGNLIYSTDTQHPVLPKTLAKISGLAILPGTVVDIQSQTLGFTDPRVIPSAINQDNPLTANLNDIPLLLATTAITAVDEPAVGWQRDILLQSSPKSWNETGEISGKINKDDNEKAGPLNTAWQLTRSINDKTQTIIILGDSDLFTTNALQQGANLSFAQNLINQIAGTSGSETINREPLGDQYIRLSKKSEMTWAIFLLLGFPVLALLFGHTLRRRFIKRYQLS